MASIADCVDIVVDQHGASWVPDEGINDIGVLDATEAYRVFLDCNHDLDLYYPLVCQETVAVREATRSTDHYVPRITGLPEVVVVRSVPAALAPGDEVGVFSEERLVGAAVYEGHVPMAIPIWRGDAKTRLPGFMPGGALEVEIWSRASGRTTGCDARDSRGETGPIRVRTLSPYLSGEHGIDSL